MNAGIIHEGEHTVIANTDIFYRNMLVENGEPYFIDYSTEAGVFMVDMNPSGRRYGWNRQEILYQTTSSLNPSATASVLPSLIMTTIPRRIGLRVLE